MTTDSQPTLTTKKLGDASLGTWFSPLGHVGIFSEQNFLAIYAVAPADVTIITLPSGHLT